MAAPIKLNVTGHKLHVNPLTVNGFLLTVNPPSPTLFKFVLLKGQILKIFSKTSRITIAMNEVPFESLSSGESFDR